MIRRDVFQSLERNAAMFSSDWKLSRQPGHERKLDSALLLRYVRPCSERGKRKRDMSIVVIGKR